jgi:hypothetical protein
MYGHRGQIRDFSTGRRKLRWAAKSGFWWILVAVDVLVFRVCRYCSSSWSLLDFPILKVLYTQISTVSHAFEPIARHLAARCVRWKLVRRFTEYRLVHSCMRWVGRALLWHDNRSMLKGSREPLCQFRPLSLFGGFYKVRSDRWAHSNCWLCNGSLTKIWQHRSTPKELHC